MTVNFKLVPLAATAATSLVTLALLAPTAAEAAVIYDSNGFEDVPSRFVLGTELNGQDNPAGPWTKFGSTQPPTNTNSVARPQPVIGKAGTNGVAFDHTNGSGNVFYSVLRNITPAATPEPIVNVDWSMNVQAPTGTNTGPFFGVEVYQDLGGSLGAQMIGGFGVDTETNALVIFAQSAFGQPAAFPALGNPITNYGTYHDYSISLNYLNDTYSVYYDGTLIETLPFLFDASQFSDAPISTRTIFDDFADNAGLAYYDNYRITTVVPEPAALAGLIGGLGAALLRKRRA